MQQENSLNQHEQSSQDQLEKLEIQRQALEHLFKITRSVENLRAGLETTLTLGESAGQRLEKGMSLYKALDQKARNLTNEEVLLRLKRIDKNLQQHLSNTLKHVANIENADNNEATELSLTTLHHDISDFKRATQTMVALQVLLNLRGVSTEPKTFNLSRDVLTQKIKTVKDREKYYRQKVKVDTLVLENDIKQLLNSENCSEAMQLTLNNVLLGLNANCQHIDRGNDIQKLPFEIHKITLTDTGLDNEKTESCSMENETERSTGDSTKNTIEGNTEKESHTQTKEQTSDKKISVIKGIGLWFNTPWHVGIKDIFKDRRL